jgi:transcriptional regulator with XRE-family HTH domain
MLRFKSTAPLYCRIQEHKRCSTKRQIACHDGPMPSIDRKAKNFELTRAGWFGNAVGMRRKALKLTASEVSRRTAELGYPISRGAIAKIESNVRSGKIDVAEVLVLARALDIPPALLLFPQFSTDGDAVVLPGLSTTEDDAVRWVSGQVSFPASFWMEYDDLGSTRVERQADPPNDGVNLIAAVKLLDQALDARISLVHHLHKVQGDAGEVEMAHRMLEKNNEQIEAIRKQIRDAREALWGMRPDLDDSEPQSHD